MVTAQYLPLCACLTSLTLLTWLSWDILAASPQGRSWEGVLASSVSPLADGIWRLLRGGLAYLVIPMLVLACVAGILIALRRGARRAALGQLVLVLGANGSVQAIKYSMLPLGRSGREPDPYLYLSGHVAVTASTILAVLLVVRPHARRLALWCAWLALSAAGMAILLTRWHSLSQVLVPMFMCGAWAVAVYAVLGAWSRPPGRAALSGPASPRASGTSKLLATSGALILAVIGLAAWLGTPNWTPGGGRFGVLGASLALVAGAAAFTVGLASAFLPADPSPHGGRTDEPDAVPEPSGEVAPGAS